jgi:cytidylate kinase
MTELVIAIDGPAGSGKSTLGRALAARLDLDTLDTGACYRAVAAEALARGIDVHDATAVAALAADCELRIDGTVTIDGRDVTEEIRSDPVNTAVSIVAAHQLVREELVAWQRRWSSSHGGGVIEGRDIGSVVFPDAAIKLYLTAHPDERARRRSEEGRAGIERRDRLDSTRAASPLVQAHGAWEIDTTSKSVDEIVAMVLERLGEGGDL